MTPYEKFCLANEILNGKRWLCNEELLEIDFDTCRHIPENLLLERARKIVGEYEGGIEERVATLEEQVAKVWKFLGAKGTGFEFPPE